MTSTMTISEKAVGAKLSGKGDKIIVALANLEMVSPGGIILTGDRLYVVDNEQELMDRAVNRAKLEGLGPDRAVELYMDYTSGLHDWRPSLREGVSCGMIIGENELAWTDPKKKRAEGYDCTWGNFVLFREFGTIDYLGFRKQTGANGCSCEIIMHGPDGNKVRIPTDATIVAVPLASIEGFLE